MNQAKPITVDTITDDQIRALQLLAHATGNRDLINACRDALERGHLAYVADINQARYVCVKALFVLQGFTS